MILMALSMSQLHLLAHDDQNDMQCDFFNHVMPLAPVLACDSFAVDIGIM